MKKKLAALKAQHKTLVTEAGAFRSADGLFASDEARTSFDAKMREAELVEAEIRGLEAALAEGGAPATEPDAEPTGNTVEGERFRCMEIRSAVTTAKLDAALADDHIKKGTSVADFRAIVLQQLATRDASTQLDSRVETIPGGDARDKMVRGAVNWLLVRSGMAAIVAQHEGVKVAEITPGEFRGMSLFELGLYTLQAHNVSTRGLDRQQKAGLAMTFRSSYQTTSDFATILENTMHKVLRAAYGITPDTWSKWCGVASVGDFRSHNWYRLGALTALEDKNEHGEFKNKNIPDAEKSSFQVGTKGNIIAVTRETIVNDDLNAMAQLASMLGRAGKLTIEKAAYTKLLLNSGLGPTMSNSQPLFHSSRSNVNATGSALGMAGLDADRVVMGAQTDVNAQEVLDLQPSVLLVPNALGGTARGVIGAEYDPDTTGKLQKPNIVKDLVRTIVSTARLTGTRRYLFADPSQFPVFLVSFLEGMQEPVIETKDGWRTDGVELRARLDFGVDVVDYRGSVTNAGQ